jgi:hypothetical protein
MRRPAAAREALRLSPLVKASWAHSSRIERVPFVPAIAKPFVLFAGRPAAERAADAGTGRVEAFLLIRLAIQDIRLVMREGAHAQLLCPSSDGQ